MNWRFIHDKWRKNAKRGVCVWIYVIKRFVFWVIALPRVVALKEGVSYEVLYGSDKEIPSCDMSVLRSIVR